MTRPDPDPGDLPSRLRAAFGGEGPPTGAMVEAVMRRAAADGVVDVAWGTLDAPFGPIAVGVTPAGLVRLDFGDADAFVERLARQVSPRVVRLAAWTDPVRRQLDEYFDGRRQQFDLALDWRLSRGFRRTVLATLHERVAYGQVTSYAELAALAGRPRAARAVGTAMATNPLALVVPCHRVLRTGGALGGYGGGLPAKRWLLDLEARSVPAPA